MADIIIYTSSTCPHCYAAKDYFNSKGLSYTEKNVSIDPQARKELMQMGYMGVPVIIVNGETIVGFDRNRLEEIL